VEIVLTVKNVWTMFVRPTFQHVEKRASVDARELLPVSMAAQLLPPTVTAWTPSSAIPNKQSVFFLVMCPVLVTVVRLVSCVILRGDAWPTVPTHVPDLALRWVTATARVMIVLALARTKSAREPNAGKTATLFVKVFADKSRATVN